MSNTTEHTPTPWTVCAMQIQAMLPGKRHATNIGNVYGMLEDETKEEARANAAFIVRAVNAHDELVEACEAFIANYANRGIGAADLDKVFWLCSAALAKARGSSSGGK